MITEYFSKKDEQIDTPTLIKEIEHVNISNSIPDTILVEANLKPKGKVLPPFLCYPLDSI